LLHDLHLFPNTSHLHQLFMDSTDIYLLISIFLYLKFFLSPFTIRFRFRSIPIKER
jgi:hypothetical protein